MKTTFQTIRRGVLPVLLGTLTACQSDPTETELLRLHLLDGELLTLDSLLLHYNKAELVDLQRAVVKNQNQVRDLMALQRARTVRDETQRLVAYLRGIRRELAPPGKALTAEQLADRRIVAAVLLEGGRADSLLRRLNRYANFLRQHSKPELQNQLRFRLPTKARFGGSYFKDASLAAALVMLAVQESKVLQLENVVLAELGQIGINADTFDKIICFS